MDHKTLTIESGNFNAGLVVKDNRVVEAAPIVGWMKGMHIKYIEYYCKKKEWKVLDVGNRNNNT